jgi:hypothetical protein
MQFFTGFFYLAEGAFYYFYCYSFHKGSLEELLGCVDTHGPSASGGWGLLLDFIGTAALVFVAYKALGWSENHVSKARRWRLDARGEDAGDFENPHSNAQGGVIHSMLRRDLKCFIVSLLPLIVVSIFTTKVHQAESLSELLSEVESPQFKANAYWSCVLWCILSLPFFILCIPGFDAMLTHSDYTGFNENGACVPYLIPSKRGDDEDEACDDQMKNDILGNVAKNPLVKAGLRVIKCAEAGNAGGRYKLGNITKGFRALRREKSQRMSNANLDQEGSQAKLTRVVDFELDTVEINLIEGIAVGRATSFKIEVVPNQGDKWRVKRRYGEFRELAKRLGDDCWSKPEAPFPRHRNPLKNVAKQEWSHEELDKRRDDLRLWLKCVHNECRHRDDWKESLKDFVAPCDDDDQVSSNEGEWVQDIDAEASLGTTPSLDADRHQSIKSLLALRVTQAKKAKAPAAASEPLLTSQEEEEAMLEWQWGDTPRAAYYNPLRWSGKKLASDAVADILQSNPDLKRPVRVKWHDKSGVTHVTLESQKDLEGMATLDETPGTATLPEPQSSSEVAIAIDEVPPRPAPSPPARRSSEDSFEDDVDDPYAKFCVDQEEVVQSVQHVDAEDTAGMMTAPSSDTLAERSRSLKILIASKVQLKGAKAPVSDGDLLAAYEEEVELEWQWGDNSRLAYRNPMRWSAKMPASDAVADILQSNTKLRPVHLKWHDKSGVTPLTIDSQELEKEPLAVGTKPTLVSEESIVADNPDDLDVGSLKTIGSSSAT